MPKTGNVFGLKVVERRSVLAPHFGMNNSHLVNDFLTFNRFENPPRYGNLPQRDPQVHNLQYLS